MNYGLPYMGSKNRIAKWVISHFPEKDNLYDLFCGGGAITHCAILDGKFSNYYMNDIHPYIAQAFVDCANGEYKDESRWISKEDFNKLKNTGDIYVDLCFSFGSNVKGYAYSVENEQMKKASHYAIFFNDYTLIDNIMEGVRLKGVGVRDRCLEFKRIVKNMIGRLDLQHVESLNRLQSLEGLTRLQSLEGSNVSYSDVCIKPSSLIYCDMPYCNTATYHKQVFDYEQFYDWCSKQSEQVIISEYWMPEDRFIVIGEKEKLSTLSATNNSKKTVEKLFIPIHQVEMYNNSMSHENDARF